MNKNGAKRTSVIWSLTSEEFSALVSKCKTTTEILAFFGLKNIGGNSKTVWRRIRAEEIDTSHLTTLRKMRDDWNWRPELTPLEEVLVENSSYDRRSLKQRLLQGKLLDNKCYICEMLPVWESKPLVLRLDHINGVRDDNRIENLRFVCPNCDSQLDTFCGKHVSKSKLPKCAECGKRLTASKSLLCSKCVLKKENRRTKIVWPDDDDLLAMVAQSNRFQVSKKLGISATRMNFVVKRILAARSKAVTLGFDPKDTGSIPVPPSTQ
jgi:hypothetical protein